MKAVIERIEDGKTAVILVENSGVLHVPLKNFPFKVYEGMHLSLDFKPDLEEEEKRIRSVKKLRKKLLEKKY